MSDNLHPDGSENSAEDDSGEDPYADSEGEPIRCDRCGEYVALHYHPQGEYPAHYAGFVAHCECSAGPQLEWETVEGLDPRWYADMVIDSEEDGEDWLEYYFPDAYDAENWTGGDDGEE